MQVRPISAKVGDIKSVRVPGPQDYSTVSTDLYRRRAQVIPKMTFATAARDTSRSKSNERVPGPQTYNSNKDLLLKH